MPGRLLPTLAAAYLAWVVTPWALAALPFVAATDDAGSLYVAESNGDGSWSNWRWLATLGNYVRSAAVADFTGDGAMDIVAGTVYSGSTLALFLWTNDGANAFRNAGPVASAANVNWAYGMAEGDFDRDGRMDFAVNGDSSYLLLAFGDGRGGFAPQVLSTGRGNGRGLDAADVDHDGDLDLVRGTTDGRLYLWRNNGSGVFTESTFLGSRSDPWAVAVGDFDGDGNADVLAAEDGSGDPYLYAGRGDGTFAAPVYVPTLDFDNYGSYDNGDFNGDGFEDIVAATYSSRQVYYYPGRGDGRFGSAVRVNSYDTGNHCLGLAAPPGPSPVGAPKAAFSPDPAVGLPGATVAFSAAGSAVATEGPWWDAAWGKRQVLLVNNRGLPARAGNRVRLRVPFAAGMATDFADLRFVDGTGGLLSHWLESQTDGGEALVWLRLPLLAADVSNAFYLYFGNPVAASISNEAAVFADPGRSTGAGGALEVTAANTMVNVSTWLSEGVPAGSQTLPVADGTGLADGDTVLVIQMQNGTDGQAGLHEFATIASGGGTTTLTVAAPLANAYRSGSFAAPSAQAAQVVRVPNYTEVEVRSGASLTAPAWNGRCGGVLAFVASGTVTVEAGGTIQGDALGFRGTAPRAAVYQYATGQQGESSVGRGSQSFAANGSGGGGGEGRGTSGNDAAGGGGGGHGLPGGPGGGWGSSDGGASGATSGDLGLAALLPGGGGGEGGADEDGGRPGNGGAGGGIVLLRAARAVVDGSIRSNGGTGGNGSNDVGGGGCGMGGGGGGAGGAIYLDAVVSGGGTLTALGGSGGGSNGCGGSGGAGGEGRIYINGNAFSPSSSPAAWGLGACLLPPQALGATTAYAWAFGDGVGATGVTASHTFPAAEGDYPVLLTVTDPAGRSDSTVGLVRLLGGPPVADAGGPYTFDERYAVGGVWSVVLDGSGSSDDSGGPLRYVWRLGDDLSETFDHLAPDGLPSPGLWTWSPAGVSLSSGAVRLEGAGSWSNCYLGTAVQYPRRIGQSFQARVLTTTGGYAMWGLKNTGANFSYEQLYYAIYFVPGAIQVYEGGSYRGQFLGFGTSVSYDVRLDVDYFGARYYLRETGQPAWTLFYESGYSNSSPFRVAATVYSGTFLFDDWTTSDSAPALANPAAVYPREGTYTATLTVTDPVGQEGTDEATVALVHGALPVADPGGPYLVPESAANCNQWTVQLDGSGSWDPEGALRTDGLGGIYRHVWEFGDGTTGTGATPTHTYAAAGTYTVTLTVWDQALQTASAQTTVTTQAGAPPVAEPGGPYAADEHAALGGLWTVSLDGSASWDDVGVCDYSWDFGDGSAPGSGPTPSHQYPAAGTYTVTLTVRDHAQQEHQAGTTVTVAGNEPPVATAGPDRVVEVGLPFTLDAGASTDDLGIWRYGWDFGLAAPWWASGVGSDHGDAFIYGVGSWDNRYLVSQTAFPRVAGASFTGTVMLSGNRTSTGRHLMWGLHNGNSGSFSYPQFPHAIYFADGNAYIYENGAGMGWCATYIDGVPYECRIDLGAAGAVYYLRQLGAEAWTRLYESTAGGASPLHIGVTVAWGTARVASFAGPEGPIPLPPSLSSADRRLEVKYSVEGTFRPTVTVTDHARQTDTASLTVTVVRGQPPLADAGGPYTTGRDAPTRLNGRGSQDDFGIEWYLWDFGDGTSLLTRNPWVDHRYAAAGAFTLSLTCLDYAGQPSTDTTTVSVTTEPVVACVPWQFQGGSESPHDLVDGHQTRLKGVCWSADTTLQYRWDFGDGSASDWAAVVNRRLLEATHTYAGAEGQPFVATLTVRDSLGQEASDTYPMRIRAPSLDTDINIAIDEGLWWLHGAQLQATFAAGAYGNAAVDYGYWNNTNGHGDNHSVSASSVQCFMVNGHLELSAAREDPYAETVSRALHWLGTALRTMEIGPQPSGDPDTDHDRLAIEVNTDNPIYRSGPVLDAVCATSSASTYAITGPVGLIHQSYSDIARDMADAFFWGQSDPGQWGVGGWRYGWNAGDSDNSAAQWAAIGLFAAEHVFKIETPQWVRDNNDAWLSYSFDGNGFGYTGRGNGNCTTPSGMVQLAFVEARAHDDPATAGDNRDPRWAAAEAYIASQWNSGWWYPNSWDNGRFAYYGYYAFVKAMRLAYPAPVETLSTTGLNWFRDEANGLARRLLRRQDASGHFTRDSDPGWWIGEELTQSWAILMLSPTLFVQPPVADAGEDRVWGARSELYPVFPDLTLDGSRSYHLDPFRALVRYEWDADGDGIYETASDTDPTVTLRFTTGGLFVVHADGSTTAASAELTFPAGSLPRSVTAVLRVTDNNDPATADIDSLVVLVADPPHAPVAAAGGPYHARVGVPIHLDGSDSLDIDPGDFITLWEWEVDGDNLFDDLTGEAPLYTFAQTGVFHLGLRVWDNATLSDRNDNGIVGEPEDRLTDTAFATVYVTTNSAPVLDGNAALRFAPVTEDDGDPPGDLLSDLLLSDPAAVPDPITDADGDPEGIAVTGTTGDGTWQWQTDGSAWTDFGAVGEGAALLLPDSALIRFLPRLERNYGQTATLTFRAWDRTSGTAGGTADTTTNGGITAFSLATATSTLAVTDVNDPPSIAGTPATSVDQDTPYVFVPSASDPDPGDTLTFAIVHRPAWASFSPATGALTGTPGRADVGVTAGIVIRVYDAAQAFADLPAFDLAVLSTNEPPTATPQTLATPEDAPLAIVLSGSDPDEDALSFSVVDPPEHGTLDGTPPALVYSPVPDWNGEDHFTFRANDGVADSAPARVDIAVTPVNDAPVLGGTPPAFPAITEDATDPAGTGIAGLFGPLISDVDAGAVEGLAVTGTTGDGTWQWQTDGSAWTDFGAVGESAALLLPDSALIRFLPRLARNYGQTATLTFRAWDRTSGTAGGSADTSANGGTTAFSLATATSTLAVTDVNDPPSIAGTPATSVDQDAPYAFVPSASDPDPGDRLTFAILHRPPWASFSPATGALTGTPGRADVGVTAGIVIRVYDAAQAFADLPAFDLAVLSTNEPPTATPQTLATPEDAPLAIVLSGSDPDEDALSFGVLDPPEHGSIEGDPPALVYSPVPDWNGEDHFTFRANDGVADSAPARVDIAVSPVNDAPVLDGERPRELPEVTAGDAEPPSSTVRAMLRGEAPDDGLTDVDAEALEGIAIAAVQTLAGGRWQFRLHLEAPWEDFPAVSATASLLLPAEARIRFLPPASLASDRTLTATFRGWDQTSGTAGGVADSTVNGGTTAFSTETGTFTLEVHAGGETTENWWYPAFSWEPLAQEGKSVLYEWYHVQVLPAEDLGTPYFEANVQGTAMTAVDYFLAAFDGFPGGTWLWRYRGWDPAADSYGAFVPASLGEEPDPAYVLELDYGPAVEPADLDVENTAPGIWLLSFLTANARAYEVLIVRDGDGLTKQWRHAYLPGEDPDKATGLPADFGQDNPPMEPPLIPRDQPATLAVNLSETGAYRLYVRGFNPTDERDGLPEFSEFPQTITIATPQPAYPPPGPTGLFPRDGDVIGRTESVTRVHCRLHWDPLPGADRFLLYLAAADGTPAFDSSESPDLNLPAGPYFDFVNLREGTTLDVDLRPGSYTWQVVGINDAGAAPDYGLWSEARHFEIIPAPVPGAVPLSLERSGTTGLRLHWSPAGAFPELVEAWLWQGKRKGWLHYAPQGMTEVDGPARTGVIELPGLSRGRRQLVRLRGYALTSPGELTPGEVVEFPVPSIRESRRALTDTQ